MAEKMDQRGKQAETPEDVGAGEKTGLKICVTDTETTGVDDDDAIVEIACVELDENLLVKNTFTSLVNPERPIKPIASAIHHLIDEDVVHSPKLDSLMYWFDGADYIVAHNAKFDQRFLPDLQNREWIDTYKCAVRIWPDAPGHSLQVLRYWLGMNDIPGLDRHTALPHRALPDALVCAALLKKIRETGRTLEAMARVSRNPALLPYFTFGKHAMKPIKEVDTGYLKWILDMNDFDEDVLYTARVQLGLRKKKAA